MAQLGARAGQRLASTRLLVRALYMALAQLYTRALHLFGPLSSFTSTLVASRMLPKLPQQSRASCSWARARQVLSCSRKAISSSLGTAWAGGVAGSMLPADPPPPSRILSLVRSSGVWLAGFFRLCRWSGRGFLILHLDLSVHLGLRLGAREICSPFAGELVRGEVWPLPFLPTRCHRGVGGPPPWDPCRKSPG